MATTSIWAVKGWLGKVVLYIENPDKTDNPKFYRQEELTDVQTQSLSDVIDYAVRAEKTTVTPDDESAMVVRQFISGINCLPSTARDEMLAVKKRFGKEDGVIAYHGYQSFAPGEATPELAHEIGVKLAQRLWGERYQVLVATHLDKENHLHNHFVLNTVSFVDGIKYHRTEKDYHDMRTVSDTLCREYNLSVIQRPQAGKSKHYGEWRAEQEQRPTWRGLIRSEIGELIRQSVTEKQFYYLLRQKGYEVKFGKDISVRPPGKERFVRLTRNFGEAYTAEAIRQRILQQPLPQPERQMTDKPRPKTYRVQGSRQAARKITGFRALYFYYCYKLGIFPKGRPQNRARLHFLLREDLLKLNNISQEVRLLARHQIDTAEQLALYKKEQEVNIRELSAKRRVLQNALRTKAVRDSPKQADAYRAQIRELSERLKALRREVHLCDDIVKTCGSFAEVKKPEVAIKLFVRFALAKAVVTYGLELMMALFSIVQGVISTIMTAASMGTAQQTVLPAEIVTAIEDCGFWESIPLWAVALIGGLFITILSFIMILSVYGRFFKLYIYTAIAPVPLATFAGEPSQQVGKSFLKSYAAVCLEGAIIVLACIIFSLFASSPPVVDPNAAAVTQVWSYIGELIFNLLVLVGTVKMADRVVREMMGL